MKSSTIVAAALMIGFVSVLVYRVSASDALGLGQLPMPAKSADVAAADARPLAVEFIVQQCDMAMPDASPVTTLRDVSEVGRKPEPARSTAPPSIADQFVIGEGVPEFVLEEDPIVEQTATVVHSPSILYIQ